ncbi:MAG: ABA4-like family protein [Cyanobacteria bacterium P01_A01_bin.135]
MFVEFLFNAANIFVLPFWALMILLPNWQVTRRVMDSALPFVALAALYIYFFALSITPESAQSFSSAGLSDIAQLFSDERVAATGWVHFLVMDLLAGRWIYQVGQEQQIFTRHSLALCLFAGPMGVLSHIVTRWLTLASRGDTTEQPEQTLPTASS